MHIVVQRLKVVHRVSEDGDELGVAPAAAEHLGHLVLAPLGVQGEDVVPLLLGHARPGHLLVPGAVVGEGELVLVLGRAQVAPPVRQHEVPAGVQPEPEEDVLDGAGGCLVGLHEPDLASGRAGLCSASVTNYFRFTGDGRRHEQADRAEAGGRSVDARGHVKENHHKEQSRNDKISSEVISVVSVATSVLLGHAWCDGHKAVPH